jgi:DNA methylase
VKPHGGNTWQETKGFNAPGRTFYDNESNRHADPDGTETVAAWSCEPDCPVALLDQQSGPATSTTGYRSERSRNAAVAGTAWATDNHRSREYPGETGGASRFYYTAKASRAERITVDGERHPCVKPLPLMRWLVRLVTPPGGTVLDPFCGSGSTLVAAAMEGFRAVGIEADEKWCRGSAQRVREIPPIQEAFAL